MDSDAWVTCLSYVATALVALFVGFVVGFFLRGGGVTMPGWLLFTTYLGVLIVGIYFGVKWANPSRYAGG